MNITTINRFLDDTPLLLLSCAELILQRASAEETRLGEHPYDARLREAMAPKMSFDEKSGIGTIPVHGVLAYKPDAFEMAYLGMEDTSALTSLTRKAAVDPAVKAIMFDVHSPGGMSIGGFDMADAVKEATKSKPTMAFIGGLGASLAYLIASQAGEVVATRDSRVGSIGAMNVNIDRSRMVKNMGIEVEVFKNKEAKYKAIGQVGTSLTDDHRDYLKANAQNAFDEFKSAVLSMRPDVPAEAMQGQLFSGKEALEKNLVDSNGSLLSAIAKLRSRIR